LKKLLPFQEEPKPGNLAHPDGFVSADFATGSFSTATPGRIIRELLDPGFCPRASQATVILITARGLRGE
jgi:hypothetical protein